MISLLAIPFRRIIQYSLLVVFIVSGCASLDDFLEIHLEEQEPLVLFPFDAYQAEINSLVLIGIENPDIDEGMQSITLRFYLRNENNALSIIHGNGKNISSFLPFARIDAETALQFNKDFPELKDLTVFGLFLQGMKVDKYKSELYSAGRWDIP